jgi:hypothetical protein
MKRFVLACCVILSLVGELHAGNIQGQGRKLDGVAVPNVTATVLRSDGVVLFRRTFAGGNYNIPIADASLFANDKSVSIIFQAPGRDDARLDNILGTALTSNLDVVLPDKLSAPAKCSGNCYCRRCFRWRRCR